MGIMYTCELPSVARTTSFDFFELTPADDKILIVHAIDIGQTTEVGDAAEEQLDWTIRRGGTGMTSGSAGTGSVAAANGIGLSAVYATSSFTYDAGNTTVATFTSGVIVYHSAFNVRSGLLWIPTPEMRPIVAQTNGGLVVRCESTPADSITFVGTITVEEVY